MADDCLFCKIMRGEIPADVLHDGENVLAFRDIDPQAPLHVLVIPKRHIATLNDTDPADAALLGELMLVATQLAEREGLAERGYRLVLNTNKEGGQAVYHIHLHLLGGRQMSWPPG